MSRPTTTYAKRDKRRSKERNAGDIDDVDDIERDDQVDYLDHPKALRTCSKSRYSQLEGLRKKQKLSVAKELDGISSVMSVQHFQTPFPTLQAQSQVFKLPSTTPQPSPGILSPVPIVAVSTHSKTNSKNLKENANQPHKSGAGDYDKSWYISTVKHGDSSKTLSSMTLTSGPFSPANQDRPARSRSHSRGSNSSRSASCSSSNSNSSRMSKTKSVMKLKHTHSLSSLKTDERNMKPKNKQKRKSSKNAVQSRRSTGNGPASKSIASGAGSRENFLSLASPFVSRASSPVEPHFQVYDERNAHIATHRHPDNRRQELMGPPALPTQDLSRRRQPSFGIRTALSDAFFDPNIPGGHSQSAHTSRKHEDAGESTKIQRLRTKKKLPSKIDLGSKLNAQDSRLRLFDKRERRPSAPSSLRPARPQRQISLRSDLRHEGEINLDHALPDEKKKLRLASGLDIVLGSRPVPRPELALRGTVNKIGKEDDSMDWMHSRGGVDFNRPPSQMSVVDGGRGFGYNPEPSDVFLSSEDDEERPVVRHLHRRMSTADMDPSLKEKFAFDPMDICAISTPSKVALELGLKIKTKRVLAPLGNPTCKTKIDGYETDGNGLRAHSKKERQKAPLTLIQTHSLPSMSIMNETGLTSSSSLGLGSVGDIGVVGLDKNENKEHDENEDEEVNMEWTASSVTYGVELVAPRPSNGNVGGEDENVEDKDDMTPWIMDSIISPPTAYLQWKARKYGNHAQTEGGKTRGDSHALVGHDYEVKAKEKDEESRRLSPPSPPPPKFHQKTRLSSPFKLSDADCSPFGRDISPSSVFVLEKDSEGNERGLHAQDHQSEVTSSDAPGDINNHSNTYSSSGEDTTGKTSVKYTKRTRSGTIVPVGAPVPPGARRTRSGTIVGPLPATTAPTFPLPSVPATIGRGNLNLNSGGDIQAQGHGSLRVGMGPTRRTRSGTIIASNATVVGGRTRSGSIAPPPAVKTLPQGEDKVANTHKDKEDRNSNVAEEYLLDAEDAEGLALNAESEVECYVDSLYLPRLSSSPDPIDFLRFASIVEDEEDEQTFDLGFNDSPSDTASKGMAWYVASDPPSPKVTKNTPGTGLGGSGGILRGRGLSIASSKGAGLGWRSVRAVLGGRGKSKKTRFHGGLPIDAEEEREKAGDEELSDDELQLLPGATASLWA